MPRLRTSPSCTTMPPVARSKPATPVSERERELDKLVDEKFASNIAAFSRAVAARTQREPTTEKKAYYRIINGESGDLLEWRLGHYAAVLDVDPKSLLEQWEEPAATDEAAPSELPLNLSTRQLRDALQALIERVDRLSGQVERLGRRGSPRTQQEGRSR